MLVLLAGVVAAGVLLLVYVTQLTFVADDWALLVVRDGWGASYFLDPYNEHILIGPAVVFKVLLEIFGMDSATPFFVAAIATFLASAVLLFVYLRRRIDDWLAVVLTMLVLFLGAAFEDLFFAFQVGYFVSILAGLGVLLMLDREDERGDWIACVLLVVSVAFSSIGLVFVIGALVDVVLGRRPRARRAYMVAWPVLLFAMWWVGWGHDAESKLSFDNLVAAPWFVFESAAAGITSLLGLASGDGSEPDQPHLIWGKLVLILGAALLAVRCRRAGMSRGLAVVLAIGLSFWFLAAINKDEARFPTSSRYQYPSAIFLLLILGEALKGLAIPRRAVVATAVVGALAVWGGISLMDREFSERWRPVSDSTRSSLAAVDLAAPNIDPEFPVSFPPLFTVPAERYLTLARSYGSPGFDEAELAARPEAERAAADLIMAQALDLRLVAPEEVAGRLSCRRLEAGAGGELDAAFGAGTQIVENVGPSRVDILLSRFAEEPSVSLGGLEPGGTSMLRIPEDGARAAWNLDLQGTGSLRLCTAA